MSSLFGDRRLRVCVYCSSSSVIDQSYIDLADETGTGLAKRGFDLVSGAGSVSCMGAVARAVRRGGGHTIGVIPRALLKLEVADEDADELYVTETMRERKAIMDGKADAFLALPGGLGTLEELFEVWTARVLGMHTKPVVALDPDGLFAPLRKQVDVLVEQGFVRADAVATLRWASTVDEALDLIVDEIGERPPAPDDEELVEGE